MLMVIMSRLLSELLGASEPMFSLAIERLERASGMQSIDVRLSAEIAAKGHLKTRALGLDPRDTNGPELYHALLDMVRVHDEFLVKAIGGKDPTDVEDLLPRIVRVTQRIRLPKQVWAIKHSVGKRLLKSQPPRKLMRALGYRSIDSLLKRESIGEIFAALRFAETPEWQQRFVSQYSKLIPSDFESRPIEIMQLNEKKWAKITDAYIRSQHHNVTHSKEMGVILVLPLPVKKLPGVTITVLPLLIHYINELRIYSAYFKLQQVKSNFGGIIVNTLLNDPAEHASIAGQAIHWRTIHKHFGSQPNSMHPEVFEPHVQAEDLEWREAEEVLFYLEPALQFWQDMDWVGIVKDKQLISFNLMDVSVNYINQLPYNRQVSYNLRRSLLSQIYRRYLGHPALEAQVLRQLDSELVESDLVAVGRVGK